MSKPKRGYRFDARPLASFCAFIAFALARETLAQQPPSVQKVADTYCMDCHGDVAKGGLNLTTYLDQEIGKHSEVWEKVLRRLTGRQMPPADRDRPAEAVYASTVSQLQTVLD